MDNSSVVDEKVNADEGIVDWHRTNLKKTLDNLLKILEWETVGQVLIVAGVTVWPLRRSNQDRPFGD